MPEYRWKVTLLPEGMLIWNCQQLFWRIPWLLWSLHPTECPNFDTESHGCGYLYILWENRFPPRNRFFFPLYFWGYPRYLAMPQKWVEELLWQSKKTQNRLVFADHTHYCYLSLFFTTVEDCSCDFHIAKYQGHSQRVQTNASLTILTVYWFSLWNLCCFSAGPPTVALTASPTGGSRWHKSVGPDAEWSPPMHLCFQKPHLSPLQDNQPDLIEIPHTKPESPASPALLLAVLFIYYFINNSKCKSLEQMLREKKGRRRTGGRWGGVGGIERKKKHKCRTKQPSWSTFATGSQWSHPVFLWGCVWTKRSLKLGYSTVLWHHYGHY